MRSLNFVDFFGLKLSVFDEPELIETINSAILTRQKIQICDGYNFGMFPYFKKYPEIPKYSNQFDILGGRWQRILSFYEMLGYPVKSDLSIPFMVEDS